MSDPTGDPPDSELYDLAPDTELPKRAVPIKPPAPPSGNTLGYRATRDEKRPSAEPDQIMNLYAPLWLLGGGVAVDIGAAFFTQRHFEVALVALGIQLVFGTFVMLVGLLTVAKLRQIDLGPFWPAVLKLAAVCVAPGAIIALATPLLKYIPLGGLAGLVVQFVLFFAMLGALFNMEESDTWSCVIAFFLINVGLFILLRWAMGA